MKLAIIYGSESLLLKTFIENFEGNIIRLYNNRLPKNRENCHDIKYDNEAKKNIEKYFQKNLKNLKQIIFLGVAFGTDKKLFWAEEEETISQNLKTNIINYIDLTKLILPYMMKIKSGKFIYLSSFRSQISTRGTAIYSSSKAFGEMFFKSIGQEYGGMNITSNIIRMGYFDGRILDTLGEDAQKKVVKRISLKRLGDENDMYKTINYCIENQYSNSGILDLNGGIDFN